MDYTGAITAEALGQGVEPQIALAVARRESGMQQFDKKGRVKLGKAGEVGMFQIKPATAPGIDLSQAIPNIKAGVGELARLHKIFPDWPLAIAAYNWGEGHVQEALKGLIAVPAMVQQYVDGVLGHGKLSLTTTGKLAAVVGPQVATAASTGAQKAFQEQPMLVALGLLVGAVLLIRILR